MGFRFPQMTPTALESLLPQGSADGLCLTGQMLQWEPVQRPNASKVLQHPFFEGCVQEASHQLLAPGGAVENSCRRASNPEVVATATSWRLPKLPLSTTSSVGVDSG